MELEDSVDDNPQGEGGDDGPSLGSFDRMADQSKAWTSRDPMAAMGDNEQDDCDHEDTTRQRKAKHPASAIRTDSTNRSRSATGKW
jgi:hypothetical protein